MKCIALYGGDLTVPKHNRWPCRFFILLLVVQFIYLLKLKLCFLRSLSSFLEKINETAYGTSLEDGAAACGNCADCGDVVDIC